MLRPSGASHQSISQRQVGPVSVNCDAVECHGIPVWQRYKCSKVQPNKHRRGMTSGV